MKKHKKLDLCKEIQMFIEVAQIACKRINELVMSKESCKFINSMIINQNVMSKQELLDIYINKMKNDPVLSDMLKDNKLHYVFNFVNGFNKLSLYSEIVLKKIIAKYQKIGDPVSFYQILYDANFYNDDELKAFIKGLSLSDVTQTDIEDLKQTTNSIKKFISNNPVITFIFATICSHYLENGLDKVDDYIVEASSYVYDFVENKSNTQKEQQQQNLKSSTLKKKSTDYHSNKTSLSQTKEEESKAKQS
jgi:hypothetical protein